MRGQTVVFGLDVPAALGAVGDPVATARAAEALGFDFVRAASQR